MLTRNVAKTAVHQQHRDQQNYRPDIDGLRAIAVLSVVLFHAGVPGFPAGFVGVDIFFVISGYLISGLIYSGIEAGRFSLITFYLRRAKRIFPALAVVLIGSAAGSWFILAPNDFSAYGNSLVSTVFFISNFYFNKHVGYFDGVAFEKPLLHTWSLSIEEQFYILFPLALTSAAIYLNRRKLSLGLLACTILGLVIAEITVRHDPDAAFFLLPSRAWELLLGAFVAVGLADQSVSRSTARLISLIGLSAILASIFFLDEDVAFPGINAVFPCGGAALLIFAGRSHSTIVQKVLAFRPIVFVGLISYSLYLWHWPIFSLSHYYFNRELTAAEVIIAIGSSLALASITWRFVEQPVRYSSLGLLRPARAIALAAMPLLLLAGLGEMIQAAGGFPWRMEQDIAAMYAAGRQRPVLRKTCHGAEKALVNDEKCNFGVPRRDASFDMVVWGDSHADHLVPALSEIAQRWGWSGRQISESACIPLWNVSVWKKGRVLPDCEKFGHVMDEFLLHNPSLKLIVLASRWAGFAADSAHKAPAGSIFLVDETSGEIAHDNTKRVIVEHLNETLARFTRAGIKVVIVGQIPESADDILNCMTRELARKRDASSCKLSAGPSMSYLRFSNDLINTIAEAADRHMVKSVMLSDFLCTKESCQIELNGVPLYTDRGHLSNIGSKQLVSFLSSQLDAFTQNEHNERANSDAQPYVSSASSGLSPN